MDDLYESCDTYRRKMGERIQDWHQERGNVAKRLPMVSRHWLHALKRPMNLVIAEADPWKVHKNNLDMVCNRIHEFRISRFGRR